MPRALSPVYSIREIMSCALISSVGPDIKPRALSPVHNVLTACFVPSHQSTMSWQLVSCPLTSPHVLTACFVPSHQSTMFWQLVSCPLTSPQCPDSLFRALSPVHNVLTACFVPSHQSTCPDSLFRALSPVHNVLTACFVPSHQSTMSWQLVSCPLTSPQCPDSLFRALSPVHNVLTACFVFSLQSIMFWQLVSCSPLQSIMFWQHASRIHTSPALCAGIIFSVLSPVHYSCSVVSRAPSQLALSWQLTCPVHPHLYWQRTSAVPSLLAASFKFCLKH